MVIAGRVIQGAAGATILACGLSLLSVANPGESQLRAVSLWGAAAAVGAAAGPLLGGVLVEVASWQALFWVDAGVAVACMALTAAKVTESRTRTGPRSIDFAGSLLVGLTLMPFVLAVSKGADWGWTSLATLASLAVSVAAGFAFVAVERRVAVPMLDLALLRNRVLVGSTIAILIGAGTINGLMYLVSLYFQDPETLDFSPLEAGLGDAAGHRRPGASSRLSCHASQPGSVAVRSSLLDSRSPQPASPGSDSSTAPGATPRSSCRSLPSPSGWDSPTVRPRLRRRRASPRTRSAPRPVSPTWPATSERRCSRRSPRPLYSSVITSKTESGQAYADALVGRARGRLLGDGGVQPRGCRHGRADGSLSSRAAAPSPTRAQRPPPTPTRCRPRPRPPHEARLVRQPRAIASTQTVIARISGTSWPSASWTP